MKRLLVLSLLFSFLSAKAQDTTKNKVDTAAQNQTNLSEIIKIATAKDSSVGIENLLAKRDRLQHEVDSIDRIQNKGQKQITDLNSKLADLKKTRLNLDKEIQTLRKEDSIAKDELKKVAAELEILKKDTVRLKTDTANLHKEKQDLQNKVDNAKLTYDGVVTSYKNQLNALEDSLDIIAVIRLKDSIVIEQDTNPDQKAKIQNVIITLQEGMIYDIYVYTDKGLFRNKSAPLDLVHIAEERSNDRLYLAGSHSTEYLNLRDVIEYIPRHTYRDIPYIEKEINLSPRNFEAAIRESTSVNSYVNVAAFTDIGAISGQPNGLVQAEAALKFITNTRNRRGKAFLWLNYLQLNGFFAKFDSQFRGVELKSDSTVIRIDLFQRAHYQIGVKQNIMHWISSPYPHRLIDDIELNVGYNVLGAKTFSKIYKDSAHSIVDSSFKSVVQNQFVFEPVVNFTRHRNIGLKISIPLYFQSVKASSGIKNREWIPYLAPSVFVYYSSKKSPENKLFFRYATITDIKSSKFGFVQAQIGYSANLSQFFNIKSE